MADDIAVLGIRINSLEAEVAKQRLDGLNRASQRSEGVAAKMESRWGKVALQWGAVVGVVGGVSAALGGAIRTTTEFDKAVSELSAITGATGKDLAFLRDKAKEFGTTTTLSASEAAAAFKLVASAKPDLLENAQALSAVTKEVIALAEATGEDLPASAITLGSALNQFKVGAEEASRFVNVLAAGAQKGASEVRDTAEALKYAGTVAGSVGLSFEEANAAIQQLSTISLKASEAGSGIRNVLLKLEAETNDRFKPSVVGFTQALKNLRDENLSTAELTEMFGLRSVVAAQELIKEADAVEDLTKSLTGTNIAYEQQRTNTDNLAGDIKGLRSAYEGLSITVGDRFTPSLRGITQAMTAVTYAFDQAVGESDAAGESFSITAEVIKGLANIAGTLAYSFQTLAVNIAFAVDLQSKLVARDMEGAKAALRTRQESIDAILKENYLFHQRIEGGREFIKQEQEAKAAAEAKQAQLKREKQILDAMAESSDALDIDRILSEKFKQGLTVAELDSIRDKVSNADAFLDELAKRSKEGVTSGGGVDAGQELKANRQRLDELRATYEDEAVLRREKADAEIAELQSMVGLTASMETERARLIMQVRTQLAEDLRSIAEEKANEKGDEDELEQIRSRYATERELASTKAAEDIEALAALTLATAEQEQLRADTIQAIRLDLAEKLSEMDAEEVERAQEKAEELAEQEAARREFDLEMRAAFAEDDIEREQVAFEAKLERMAAQAEALGLQDEEWIKWREALEEQHQKNLTDISDKGAEDRRKFMAMTTAMQVKTVTGDLMQMTSGVAQHNKTMFKINKAAAIANAVVSMPAHISETMGKYPFPVSVVMGALAAASSLAQIQAIKSTSFSGGGGGTTPSLAGSVPSVNSIPMPGASGGGGGSSGSMDTNSDLLNPQQAVAQKEGQRTTVVVTGNVGFTPQIIDQIADGLRTATNERDVTIFDTNSRQARDLVEVAQNGSG